MTRAEVLAYNAGVSDVIALALKCAATLEPRLTEAPTRFNFAIGALEAIAREGAALLLPSLGPELPIGSTPKSGEQKSI